MIGNLLIIISVIATVELFFAARILAVQPVGFFLFLAKISGLLGSILISWNFVLATRNKFVEVLFGGLDKAYKIHRLTGLLAFIMIVNHPVFLILNSLPFNTTFLYLLPTPDNLPYAFGILGLYVMITLVILTIFVDLPYKFWKKTHEIMGLVIIFGSLHVVMISSDVSIFLPLKIWMLLFNIVALIAFFYKRYIYYFLKPKK